MWAAKSLVCASRNRMLVLLLRTRTAGPSSPTRPPNIPNQNPPPLPESKNISLVFLVVCLFCDYKFVPNLEKIFF